MILSADIYRINYEKKILLLFIIFLNTSCETRKLDYKKLEYKNHTLFERNTQKRFTGVATALHSNGEKVENTYKNGKRNGKSVTYYKNGKIASEIFYKDGKRNGKAIFWYRDGKKMSEINYFMNNKHGKVVIWNKNGTLKEESNYYLGELDGISKSYDKNGVKRMEALFKKGKRSILETKRWDAKGNRIK